MYRPCSNGLKYLNPCGPELSTWQLHASPARRPRR
uniref:Uncharacterized protein n=1 Tax=Arundo donax TaxID=35708 RepID=A0A0A9GNF6_ARUDO